MNRKYALIVLFAIFISILASSTDAAVAPDDAIIQAESRIFRSHRCYKWSLCIRRKRCKRAFRFLGKIRYVYLPCGIRRFRCRRRKACPTPSSSPTPSLSSSASMTPFASASVSMTPSASVSASMTPSASMSTSVTPSASMSTSVTPSASMSTSITPSASVSLSMSLSVSASPSATPAFAISSGELNAKESPNIVFLDGVDVAEGDTVLITNILVTGGTGIQLISPTDPLFLFSGSSCTSTLAPNMPFADIKIPVKVVTNSGRTAIEFTVTTRDIDSSGSCPVVNYSFDVVAE